MNPTNASPRAGAAVRLLARDLDKDFDRRPVLRGVHLDASAGEVWVITGQNGVGKSTLLRILAGLTRPTRGKVEISLNGGVLSAGDSAGQIGYMAPDVRPYEELTAFENIEILARIRGLDHGADRARRLIDSVGLSGREYMTAGTLSTGQRQRLKIALAILAEPPILLMDEPGANLDVAGRDIVARVVDEARHRGPVIIATNDPEETRLGDHGLELEQVDIADAGGF